MTLTRDEFAKEIIALGLLSAEELKAIFVGVAADQRPKSAEAFAQLLVEKGRLTKFQAKQLLSGAGTPLVLDEYRLLETIGAGSMGQVFKAQHRHMKRLVALGDRPQELGLLRKQRRRPHRRDLFQLHRRVQSQRDGAIRLPPRPANPLAYARRHRRRHASTASSLARRPPQSSTRVTT